MTPCAPLPASRSGARLALASRAAIRGFSLIEMMGVMALMAILAAITAENLVTTMKVAARREEDAAMDRFSGAVERMVRRTRMVPANSDLPVALADELGVAVSQVAMNKAGFQRRLVWDPDFRLGPTTNSVPSYVQDSAGSVPLANPRLLIVSCLAGQLPSISSVAEFGEVWATPLGGVPASWSAMAGLGADLFIERVGLNSVFRRVVFNNVDPSLNAVYTVDGGTNVTIATTSAVETWLVADTPIVFFTGGGEQGREILDEDTSYIYEAGRWNRALDFGRRPALAAGSFGDLCQRFVNAGVGGNAGTFRANPEAVLEEFHTFLRYYGQGMAVVIKTNAQQFPAFCTLKDCQVRVDPVTRNLMGSP